MPLSALPSYLQDVENHFEDDDQYGAGWFGRLYRTYQKKTKTWFCFSYRCTEWWARWRVYPIILFAIGGKGPWRWEPVSKDAPEILDYSDNPKDGGTISNYYLSRIQYYKRWHISLQWPLILSFHLYPKAKDVASTTKALVNTDDKLWFGYWGHYDADKIFWMFTSVFLGRCWK